MEFNPFTLSFPASCGEIFQFDGPNRHLSASYPLRLYNRAYFFDKEKESGLVSDVRPDNPSYAKAWQASCLCQELWGLTSRDLDRVGVSFEAAIPLGKGMGSSTADICLVIKGLSQIFDRKLSPQDLFSLACRIEPTDSIVLEETCLVDGHAGIYLGRLKQNLPDRVLVLLPRDQVDTLAFYEKNPAMTWDWQDLKEKIGSWPFKDLAAYSASLGLNPLIKKHLDTMEQLHLDFPGLAFNVAHTGSLLALWMDQPDPSPYVLALKRIDREEFYQDIRLLEVVKLVNDGRNNP